MEDATRPVGGGTSHRAGWTLRALAAVLFMAIPVIALVGGYHRHDTVETVGLTLAAAAYAAVGALVTLRRPTHRLGWIFLWAGVLQLAAIALIGHAQISFDRSWPGTAVAALLGNAAGWPGIMIAFAFTLLLFPNGRLVTPRWRWVVITSTLGLAMGWVSLVTVEHQTIDFSLDGGATCDLETVTRCFDAVDNPLGITVHPDVRVALDLGLVGVAVGGVAGIVSLWVRYRRSDTIVRLQIRWILLAAGMLALVAATGNVLEVLGVRTGSAGNWLFAAAMTGIPLAAGVAIMRYGLFEIDRIVRRTATYTITMGLMVALYAASVITLGSLLPGDRDDLAVALSTLTAAAAIRPVTTRLQSAIDRRFDRARYDALGVVDGLSTTLRDEVDLHVVEMRVLETTATTLGPSKVSMWLVRSEEAERAAEPGSLTT